MASDLTDAATPMREEPAHDLSRWSFIFCGANPWIISDQDGDSRRWLSLRSQFTDLSAAISNA